MVVRNTHPGVGRPWATFAAPLSFSGGDWTSFSVLVSCYFNVETTVYLPHRNILTVEVKCPAQCHIQSSTCVAVVKTGGSISVTGTSM